MAAATSFGVPASHHSEAIAGVVSIDQVHLDAVPESLLSIAARQSPEGEVVRLSSWQDPSVAVLQVVADRFVKSGRKCEPIAPNDVLKALDYFNIPEELWPEGLLAMAAVGRKYDREANQIMHTIKAEMTALVESMDDMSTQKQYAVGYSTSQKNVLGVWAPIGYRSSSVICPLPPSLKERLQCLADDMWFDIKFNPEEIQHGTYRGSKSSTYWSFTVAMHVPSVRR